MRKDLPKWPQDIIIRRPSNGRTVSDPILNKLDKEHFSYTTKFTQTAAGGEYRDSFYVVDSNYFYVTNIAIAVFVAATQASSNSRAGYLTLRDDSSKTNIFDNVPVTMFLGGTQRILYAIPYAISAGGSLSIINSLPATAGYTTTELFVSVEGYKDFTNG